MDDQQAVNTVAGSGLTADRVAVLSVYIAAVAIVSFVIGLMGPGWLLDLSAPIPVELAIYFGCGTWFVASIVSVVMAIGSLSKSSVSSNPQKVRRLSIIALVSNGALWLFTCSLMIYTVVF